MSKQNDNDRRPMLMELDGLLANGAPAVKTDTGDKADSEITVTPDYSLDGLNVKGKMPLEKIVAAVKRFRDGTRRPDVDNPRLTILLSGVPGGGKTAFVRYLAREAGAPLKSYRASDLLSKWIGESEKHLADAFRVAKKDNAILFLDEVDSFLQGRERSEHAWEVSGVNELLQQMESFGGVMVAATNFTDHLDRAAMRRFTFKLELDYLTNDGKRVFFDRFFKTPLSAAEAARLDAIDTLTPGDFRTVKEELFYTCDEETNAARLDALEAEAAAKAGSRRKIGF